MASKDVMQKRVAMASIMVIREAPMIDPEKEANFKVATCIFNDSVDFVYG